MYSVDESYLEDFLWWITERQQIYVKRFIHDQDPPWTEHQILRAYHFCHAQRRLDRGTQFALDHVLRPDADDAGVLLNTLFYRFFNKPETYEAIGGFQDPSEFDCSSLFTVLDVYSDHHTLFSSAYRVTTHPWADMDTKHGNILFGVFREDILPNLHDYTDRIFNADSMEAAFDVLLEIDGVGEFLGYEILTDLNYRHLPFSENDFVNIGPGAELGLERIFDEVDESRLRWLHENQRDLFEKYEIDFPYLKGKPSLTLRDLEHSACEASKYWDIRDLKMDRRTFEPRDERQDTLDNFA